MRIKISSSGDFSNITNFLKGSKRVKYKTIFIKYGEKGVTMLSAMTPTDTGETAHSWKYKVTQTLNTTELYFYNTAHPESLVNVAMLIETGHATKNGGYVTPRKFIGPVAKDILQSISKEIDREVSMIR